MTVHRHRVRYHETDAQGILFNARYWEIFDVAMAEYFRALGWSYPDMVSAGFDPCVVKAEATFHQAAVFDDELETAVRCVRVGGSSFSLNFELRSTNGTLLTSAAIVYVNFDTTTRGARPIPDVLREPLTSHPELGT
jgi:acyl-CoA thioester hydrolase